MTKYRNEQRAAQEDAELEELEKEYKKQFSNEPIAEEEHIDPPAPPAATVEEETWKKRHADLRSYTQKQINTLEQQLAALQKEAAEREKDPRLPVNKQEAEQWVKEYPDLARVIGTLIDERAERHVTSVSDEVKDVKAQLEAERLSIQRERALTAIIKKHPDFLDLVNQEHFKDWVESQPSVRGPRIGQALYDALYANETDAEAAIEAVNIYKRDLDASKPKKETRNEAALSVRRTSSTTPTSTDGKRTFSESEIDKMKPWDYEKYEQEIEDARREGRIVYDLSGAAR